MKTSVAITLKFLAAKGLGVKADDLLDRLDRLGEERGWTAATLN